MQIQLAETDAEIAACFAVMRELRPDIKEESFVTRVRALGRSGYRLAYLKDAGQPVSVAGFRFGESLAWGRFLWVDDFVTRSSQRSRGFGAALLRWLTDLAAREGCDELHLESGIQRQAAHRFYEREGVHATGLHFAKLVAPATVARTRDED